MPLAEGLVGGEGFAVDASIIRADASRHRTAVEGAAGLPTEAASRAVREYLAVLDEEAFGAATPVTPKYLSLSDPASRWTAAQAGPASFAYCTNYLIDLEHAVIVDVEPSTAVRQGELAACRTMIERTDERLGLHPERLTADTAYGSAEMLEWLVHDQEIAPHIRVFDKSKREDGTFSREDFAYDPAADLYRCPGGQASRSSDPSPRASGPALDAASARLPRQTRAAIRLTTSALSCRSPAACVPGSSALTTEDDVGRGSMSDEALSDEAFRAELVGLIPALRAFARNLCNGNATLADDVAQDALARAWTSRGSFRAGTNMKAWCFTILRNCYFTDRRRAWRHQSIDSDVLERTLVASDNVEAALELDDVRRALASLPEEQREVLILVGAGGLSYEEAASICGTPLGTTKSRVNRARLKMLEILDRGRPVRDEGLPSTALERLIQETEVRARKPGSRRSEGE